MGGAGSAPAAALSGASDPSIVIGFVATRSGAGAVAGQDLVDGFALALKQLGGRFSNQEVRVVAADDRGSPELARKAISRMIQTERLDMVVTAVSPQSLGAMMPALEDAHLFALNLETPPPAMAGSQCRANMFTLAPPADGPQEILGHHLTLEGMRSLLVVAPESALADLAIKALKRNFPFDVTVLHAKHGEATFTRETSRIAGLQPDAVYVLLRGGMAGAFVRAYDRAGLHGVIPLYMDADSVARPFLASMGDAALEARSVTDWSPDLDNGGNRRLVGEFESEFGRPATPWAARGVDAALLIDSAIKANNGRTGDAESVRAALRRADFPSVRGSFHFNHNQQPVLSYYLQKVGRDARGRLAHELLTPLAKDWRDPNTAACPLHWPEEYVPPAPSKPAKKSG